MSWLSPFCEPVTLNNGKGLDSSRCSESQSAHRAGTGSAEWAGIPLELEGMLATHAIAAEERLTERADHEVVLDDLGAGGTDRLGFARHLDHAQQFLERSDARLGLVEAVLAQGRHLGREGSEAQFLLRGLGRDHLPHPC